MCLIDPFKIIGAFDNAHKRPYPIDTEAILTEVSPECKTLPPYTYVLYQSLPVYNSNTALWKLNSKLTE